MGFFSKKYCDVCDGKIGLMGNRKLEDGNLCKDCAKKLSPFFSDRKKSTVEEIKGQLDYRADNEEAVRGFNLTRTLGLGTKVLLDDVNKKFIVSPSRKWRDENPDVLDFSQATGTYLEVKENQLEVKQRNSEGKEVSYNPRRFKNMYDFWMTIHTNHPYFDEIKFRINSSTIEIEADRSPGLNFGQGGRGGQFANIVMQGLSSGKIDNAEYRQCESIAEEIQAALGQSGEANHIHQANSNFETASTNETPVAEGKCPQCGALSKPDFQGNCEFCGGSMLN